MHEKNSMSDLVSCFLNKQKLFKKTIVYLPYLAFSDRTIHILFGLNKRDVNASYLSLVNKDIKQVVTFTGSNLLGKCLGSLFHYTQHSDEVDPEHLDCDNCY